MPVTTSRILLDRALERRCGRECVDWAVSLLHSGQGGRSAAQLAGAVPPFNPFEMAALRDRVLEELGEPLTLAGSVAAKRFALEALEAALPDDEELVRMLVILKDLYLSFEPDDDLLTFYLLYHALESVLRGWEQWEWPGATRDNIFDIIRAEAVRFIETGRTRPRPSIRISEDGRR